MTEPLKTTSPWYLYMIETKGGRLYTGITTDVERRFLQHATGKGARFFRTDPPKQLVFQQAFENRSTATRAEIKMKKLSRAAKWALISEAGLNRE